MAHSASGGAVHGHERDHQADRDDGDGDEQPGCAADTEQNAEAGDDTDPDRDERWCGDAEQDAALLERAELDGELVDVTAAHLAVAACGASGSRLVAALSARHRRAGGVRSMRWRHACPLVPPAAAVAARRHSVRRPQRTAPPRAARRSSSARTAARRRFELEHAHRRRHRRQRCGDGGTRVAAVHRGVHVRFHERQQLEQQPRQPRGDEHAARCPTSTDAHAVFSRWSLNEATADQPSAMTAYTTNLLEDEHGEELDAALAPTAGWVPRWCRSA